MVSTNKSKEIRSLFDRFAVFSRHFPSIFAPFSHLNAQMIESEIIELIHIVLDWSGDVKSVLAIVLNCT